MPVPTDEGRYIAAPTDWTVGESETGNHLLQFIVRFSLLEWWNGAEWTDVRGDHLSITGYFYLMKSDGKPNSSTIDNLKSAMGWDGASIATLANSEWSATEVQVTVRAEEYQGKTRMKVKWISPRDADPSGAFEKADPQEIQSLESKYGAMLRAMGGSAAARVAPAVTKAQTNGDTVEGAKQEAWKAFQAKWGEFVKEHPEEAANRDAKWKEVFQEQFPGGDPKALGVQQWKAFKEVIEKSWSPELGLIPF